MCAVRETFARVAGNRRHECAPRDGIVRQCVIIASRIRSACRPSNHSSMRRRQSQLAAKAQARRVALIDDDDDDDDDDGGDVDTAAVQPKSGRGRRTTEARVSTRSRRPSDEAAARAEALKRLREARAQADGAGPAHTRRGRAKAAAAKADDDEDYEEEAESESGGVDPDEVEWERRRSRERTARETYGRKDRAFYDYRSKPVGGIFREERMSDDEGPASDMGDFIADDGDEEEEEEEGSDGSPEEPQRRLAKKKAIVSEDSSSDDDAPARGRNVKGKAAAAVFDPTSSDDDAVGKVRSKMVRKSKRAALSDDDDDVIPRSGGTHQRRKRSTVIEDSDDAEEDTPLRKRKQRLRRMSQTEEAPGDSQPRGTPRRGVSQSKALVHNALARLVAVQGTQAKGTQLLEEQLRATGAVEDDDGADVDGDESDDEDGQPRGEDEDEDESESDDFIVHDGDAGGDGGGAEGEDDGRLACICGATRDDAEDELAGRVQVQCSNSMCRVWMHADCVGYAPKDESAAAAPWFCQRCKPAAEALMGDLGQLPTQGFQPVGGPNEELAPSEAAARAWRAQHSAREVGAALGAALAGDRATALMALLDWSRPGAVKIALRHARGGMAHSLLYRAAEAGATQCCRFLLRRADMREDHVPGQALCAALQAGKPATARALVQEVPGLMALARKPGTYDANGTAVHAAAAGGDAECLGMTLSGLSDATWRDALTATDEEMCTPLMLAAGSSNPAALRHIIALLGAARAAEEAKRVDVNGQTAAHYAASAGVVDSIAALHSLYTPLLHGKDNAGTTPLHLAAAEGHTGAIHELVRRGASVIATDKSGWTPLLYASGPAVQALLEHDSDEQLDSLSVHITEGSTAEVRAMRLMRTLSESPPVFSVLNAYLRDRIHVLAGHMAFLLRRPAVLDVVNKRKWLHHCTSQRRLAAAYSSASFEDGERQMLWASREQSFTDSIQWLLDQSAQRLLLPIYPVLRFVESPQAFGAGVEREWLTACAQQLAQKGTRMLVPTAEGGRSLAPIPGALTLTQQQNMRALGILMGYVLAHEGTLPVPLEAPFLRCLLGRAHTLTVDDLETVDPVYRRSLQQVLDTPKAESLGLTWEMEDGSELIAGGASIAVTDANKADFVAAAAAWKLHGRISCAVGALKAGLHVVMPRDMLAVLTEHDLALLLGGVPQIDVADWKKHTCLDGFSLSDQQVAWFWRCVTAMSAEERGLLLKLATGASAPPAGGFKELQGMAGPQMFTLQRVSAPSHHLPTASTCFNTLKMPTYATFEDLERKLLAAVRFGSSGFAFV